MPVSEACQSGKGTLQKNGTFQNSLGNEKLIVEHKEGLLSFLHCFFVINHSLGDTQQYKVLNHGVGRNLRVHEHPPHFTEKPTEANPIL